MAEFEGEKNLNKETSELEINGKFKLSEEELNTVAGGNLGEEGESLPQPSPEWPVVDPDSHSCNGEKWVIRDGVGVGGSGIGACRYCRYWWNKNGNYCSRPTRGDR